jgi:hypothetical protein
MVKHPDRKNEKMKKMQKIGQKGEKGRKLAENDNFLCENGFAESVFV